MGNEQKKTLVPPRRPDWMQPHHIGSSWVLSVALHAALLVVLGVTLSFAPTGQSEQWGREVGIVLKNPSNHPDVYEGPPEEPQEVVEQTPQETPLDSPPVDLSELLPDSSNPVLGLGPESLPDVQSLVRLPPRAPGAGGGKEGIPFFGVRAHGSRIVYVVDRSGSMANNNALGAAKVELMASMAALEKSNQFQIIFYNLTPAKMPIGEGTGRLPFATDTNKALAERFIRGISADSGTDHMPALKLALGLDPDELFLLTDADEPKMRPGDLREVARRNGGRTRIHAIEFGTGPSLGEETFLKRLARQNDGSYAYVDVTQFDKRR